MINLRYWSPYMIASTAIHLVGFMCIASLSSIPTNTPTDHPKKNSIEISLVYPDDVSNNNIYSGPGITLPQVQDHAGIASSTPENLGLSPDLDDIMADMRRQSGEIRATIADIRQGREKIRASMAELHEEIIAEMAERRESIEKLGKIFDGLNKAVELNNLIKNNGDLDKYFKEQYAPNQRTEISYSELFRNYGNLYLFAQHDKLSQVADICLANSNLPQIISLDVEFAQDGTFRFTGFRTSPEFKDDEGRAEKLYRSVLEKMPRRFVSPEVAGLEAPYKVGYYVVNLFHNGSNNEDFIVNTNRN